MAKKEIDMVTIMTSKANAQHLTCTVAFIAAAALAVCFMLAACIIPAIVNVTKVTCWLCMALEAMSAGLGYVAYWVYRNTL
jgi:hypothetical protein